jgi:aminomethyltransferase
MTDTNQTGTDDQTGTGETNPVRTTPLDALHRARGGRMVSFAGWSLPVRYEPGVMAEHLHCRAQAALFDVSHMGQIDVEGPGAAEALERAVPADIAGLREGRLRYTVLLNEAGGIIDDLIVTRRGADRFLLVVNASRRAADLAHLEAILPPSIGLHLHDDRGLLALQGPASEAVMARLFPGAERLTFMSSALLPFADGAVLVSRCGYTGEDGYEISVDSERAAALAERLLAEPEVRLAGLGARDSLRLEAGLPLWGSDIDETTTPFEAGLGFAIGKRRRLEGGFLGHQALREQTASGSARVRVGIVPSGRAPARAGTAISDGNASVAGAITSGGFGPTVGAPISMGYLRRDLAEPGTDIILHVRGRPMPARVAALPFLPPRVRRVSTQTA